MATNYFGAVNTVHAALPHLLERGAAFRNNRNGPIFRPAIVNIASIGGKIPVPHLLPYVASKFALVGFSSGLHVELRHKGIRVTTVCPGLMRTSGEVHADFVGNVEAEQKWFTFAATTPGLAASIQHAANRIYNAVIAGRTEITITPQAWLAARFYGLAPVATQYVASFVNQFLLPQPTTGNQPDSVADPHPTDSPDATTFVD